MTLEVPRDDRAELTVVGCAVATRTGYRLAASRVTPGDFYNVVYGRALDACWSLDGIDDTDERVAAVIDIIGGSDAAFGMLARAHPIERAVRDRAVQWDTNGSFARRVLRAARLRRLMAACGDLYNAIGTGEPEHRVQALTARLNAAGVAA